MSSKFSAYLVVFLLLISGSLTAATIVDSAPDARPVYQKPAPMGALAWIQHLEDERDQADIAGDYAGFKAITDEISATIAGKHGFSDRSATPEEKLAIIHSIARTRHRFMGQRHMLHDRYLGYDRAKTNSLLQTDAHFKDHMAAVLAIDAMVMKALNDDDFEEMWGDTEKDHQELIPAVIAHAQKHEKKEVFESLTPSFQHFLQTRHDTLRLANDVFSVFAPKMTLVKIYQEVMVSGDTYKGWRVHNIGAFRYAVTLTEEEKAEHPGLEERIRASLTQSLSRPNVVSNVFSSSAMAVPPSDEIREKFDLKPEEMLVEYIYDDCLVERGYGVRGTGPRRFYLSRPVNPRLARILRRPHGVTPASTLLETYKYMTMALAGTATLDVIKALVKSGNPDVLHNYAHMLADGKNGIERDIPKAIELCREAVSLGDKNALRVLPLMIAQYAVNLFHGQDGIEKDIPKAIETMREAAGLGDRDSIRNLPIMIVQYAIRLFKGTDGVEKDIPKAIETMREAWSLGDKHAKYDLSLILHDYAVMLCKGTDGFQKDIPKAMELCREAASLGYEQAIRNLPRMIAQYAVNLFQGTDGIGKNISKAIELCREAAGLGNADAIRNLPLMIAQAGGSR